MLDVRLRGLKFKDLVTLRVLETKYDICLPSEHPQLVSSLPSDHKVPGSILGSAEI